MTELARMLERMLPGDKDRGLPPFSALSPDLETCFSEELSAVIVELEQDSVADEEVNQTIKRLRAIDAAATQMLLETALELYFTHPKVTSVLQQGRTTLFPHERSLASIDYDLLEPVFEHQRGGRS